MKNEILKNEIGEVLKSMANSFQAEIFELTQEELEQRFFWTWESSYSVEYNTYRFSDLLEMYKRTCRMWEEKHNGNCCVVERVRDKYLMPKVKLFLAELSKHQAS